MKPTTPLLPNWWKKLTKQRIAFALVGIADIATRRGLVRWPILAQRRLSDIGFALRDNDAPLVLATVDAICALHGRQLGPAAEADLANIAAGVIGQFAVTDFLMSLVHESSTAAPAELSGQVS